MPTEQIVKQNCKGQPNRPVTSYNRNTSIEGKQQGTPKRLCNPLTKDSRDIQMIEAEDAGAGGIEVIKKINQ